MRRIPGWYRHEPPYEPHWNEMLPEKGSSLKDYYKILGLEESASIEEISARWLEFKKKFQFAPEKHNGTDKRINEINEAYRIGLCSQWDFFRRGESL